MANIDPRLDAITELKKKYDRDPKVKYSVRLGRRREEHSHYAVAKKGRRVLAEIGFTYLNLGAA